VQLNRVSPLWLVPIALVTAIAVRAAYGNGAFFLTLAGFALLGTIAVFWRSLQSLTGDAPLTLEEALGLGAPSVEEERKVAVLRALKDLEYERAVGKIDEEDFQRLSKKYRAQAMQLLQIVDSELSAAREQAETALSVRLREEGIVVPAPDTEVNTGASTTKADEQPPASSQAVQATPNDSGATDRGDTP
jgi:hypothetical protein